MNTFQWFLLIYVIGGVTFLPLVLCVFWFFKQKMDQIHERNEEGFDGDSLVAGGVDRKFTAGQIEEEKGVEVVRQGWLTVTRKYYYHHTELSAQDSEEAGNIPQRSQIKRKHKFYAILRHGNLFLYRDSAPKSNLVHAISLQDSFVTIWPRKAGEELPESILFTKKTCISILRKGTTSLEGGMLKFDTTQAENEESQATNQFFLYIDNSIEKEDWYFSLISASKSEAPRSQLSANLLDPNVSARTAHLRTADSLFLIQTINSTENQLTTKWINALIGRLFLAVQESDRLKDYLYTRLYQKLAKINKPDFLSDFVVEEVDVGRSAPLITAPKLLDLTPEGLTKISMNFMYKGDLSVIVSTKATISLGSRFKQREVPIQLSIKLKELSGPLLILLKPPPSTRFWYTFQTEPILSLEIEPIVSSSKLSYTMITNAIKGKFAEAIRESLVQPFWDDIVFYDTEKELYRGGIWEQYDRSDGTDQHWVDQMPSIPSQATLSSKKKQPLDEKNEIAAAEGQGSADTVNSDDEEAVNTLRTQDDTLKRRTFAKVESLRRALKNKSRETFSDDKSSVESLGGSPVVLGDNTDSEELSSSNKLFKSSIKKFGKWYKDTVNLGTEDMIGQELSSANPPSPEMISNRRKSLPRRQPPSTIPSSSVFDSDSVLSTSNATEMFANKDQKRARSSAASSGKSFNSNLISNLKQVHNQAFVKTTSDEIAEEIFHEDFVRKVSAKSMTLSGHVDGATHEKENKQTVERNEDAT
ncbi:hypothetical protein HG536_0B01820 [Torulaspora globosa]|uniref:SMP-LTD domain-containing protein n=1 Tax=Torulaspora globosa TaxID=48254 RepID=A0A7G3ZCT3_9SACH|nr:uncharacterized protein HG536_0B01820 [Torulaspora globosa]QLL31319.1 hypothetical protein HG536_0B01820 [Torulaspora globosa]